MRRRTRSRLLAVGAVASLAVAGRAAAQAIEPRAYSPAPVGLNFVIAGWVATEGGLSFDPSVPVENPKLSTSGPLLAYARTLDIFGQSGKFDVILPTARLTGSATFMGVPVSRQVDGFADPLVRVSVSLLGAPAMTARQFATYSQDLIVGASLQVSVPIGQYDPDRLVNLGAHRWSARPEIGVSKVFGAWTVEGDGAITLFSTNNDFFGSQRRAQQAMYSAQGHLVYSFRSGVWASLDATYFTGGRSSLNDLLQNDLQKNWRVGATLAVPVDRRDAIKFYASSGVSARTGNNYDLLGVAWQRRWGAGL